ncbi:hypothetical protein HD806DRAFT_266200 [Xylariaceae sp. AK1471]|nr:hypothetical protein HD806DRAFT_266200 [Xylariaceae sp. AK1471]
MSSSSPDSETYSTDVQSDPVMEQRGRRRYRSTDRVGDQAGTEIAKTSSQDTATDKPGHQAHPVTENPTGEAGTVAEKASSLSYIAPDSAGGSSGYEGNSEQEHKKVKQVKKHKKSAQKISFNDDTDKEDKTDKKYKPDKPDKKDKKDKDLDPKKSENFQSTSTSSSSDYYYYATAEEK